jgi:hypothetical protein
MPPVSNTVYLNTLPGKAASYSGLIRTKVGCASQASDGVSIALAYLERVTLTLCDRFGFLSDVYTVSTCSTTQNH